MKNIEVIINNFFEKLEDLLINYPVEIVEVRFKSNIELLNNWIDYSNLIYMKSCEVEYLELYPKACQMIEIKFSQLIFELNVHIDYFFKKVEELGHLPNEDIKLENGILLSDFVNLHYKKICDTANNPLYKRRYPIACSLVCIKDSTIDENKMIINKGINHKKKISKELFEIVEERFRICENKLIEGARVTLSSFFDKRYLWYKYYEVLKLLVNDEEIINKYPKTCKFVKFELNIKTGKLEEYLQTIEKLESIPRQNQDIYFSNGKKMNQYWKDHKDYICNAISLEEYQKMYPKACSIIEYRINKKLKLEEFLNMVTEENGIITRRNNRLFKDMTSASVYWEEYKYEIFDIIDSTNYKNIYPLAYNIIKESINNKRRILKKDYK